MLGYPIDKCTCFKKRCRNCNNWGHKEATCHFKKITHKCKKQSSIHSGYRGKGKHPARGKATKNNEAAYIKEVVFQSTKCNNKVSVNVAIYDNFNNNIIIIYKNRETLIYYDCLAESATTSHVSNC